MAMPQPVSRESDHKTFTLDDYLVDDSPFKIGLEFERSDEEIKEYLKDFKKENYTLEFEPFSGFVSVEIDGIEIGDPLRLTYPGLHLAWLNKYSDTFLKEKGLIKLDSRIILTSENPELNDYRCSHQHLFNSPSETLNILYRSEGENLKICSMREKGKIVESVVDKQKFRSYLDLRIKDFLNKVKNYFPEKANFSFKYFG